MRSVGVVLPASICAAMPMLRVHSSGNGRSLALTGEILALSVTPVMAGAAISDTSRVPLPGYGVPAEMGEGAIGLRHLVSVFLLLHDRARVVVRVDQLSGE